MTISLQYEHSLSLLDLRHLPLANLSVLFAALALFQWTNKKRRQLPLPPGPPGLPLLGNIFDIPKVNYWERYLAWSYQYGSDLIHLNILGSPAIVINTYKAANELLNGRSLTYASRPAMPMMNDFTGFSWHVAFMPYGNKWREHRKFLHRYFQTSEQLKYRSPSVSVSRRLLQNLLNEPRNFVSHLRLLSGSLILSISYGIDVKDSRDPHIVRAEKGMSAMAQAGHGYLVDFIPSLKYLPSWFPGAYFKVESREWNKSVTNMAVVPFELVKSWISQGTARPSIARDLLSDDAAVSEDAEVIRNILAAAYAAGSDTTVSSITAFILAMTMYPDVQLKGQAAVDRVLGGRRLPDFSDYGTIPYVDALVKEVLRWLPVVPLGVPYCTTKDDVYQGYHIPEGSTIYVNAWAMLREEQTYGTEPCIFKPERFLVDGDVNKLNPNVKDPTEAFGFARRFCPGMTTARESMWITIASILATFNIKQTLDGDGSPIIPSGECSSGFIR
ncbi:unnamed protein product [Cyclocybe aegerita]|uniref:Cytochrome P450 n=1 Tax=Cyclocybe aegerita TaxID=1973307 RepID=A0A8S0W7W5_CYCAE|nr:unnamed protein product [Cyclocybe aegerita]